MQIDRTRAQEAFEAYVAPYDPADPKIALKAEHTLRVAALCERIARSAPEVAAADVDLAWLLGLLHDIGRFEQVRRYGTFSDAASVPHARLGAAILFEGEGARVHAPGATVRGSIRDFAADDADDALIRTAVATHSDYRLPGALDARTRALCDVLRDADKVDILKANTLTPTSDIMNVPEEKIEASEVSPSVVRGFYEHRTLRREERSTPADVLVSFACFAFELVYPESLRALREQGCVYQILERPFTNPRTAATFAELEAHLRSWVDERLAGADDARR